MNYTSKRILVKVKRPGTLYCSRIYINNNKSILNLKKEIIKIYYNNSNLNPENIVLQLNNTILENTNSILSYTRINDIIKMSINTQNYYYNINIKIEEHRDYERTKNFLITFEYNSRVYEYICSENTKISLLRFAIKDYIDVNIDKIKLFFNNQELINPRDLKYYYENYIPLHHDTTNTRNTRGRKINLNDNCSICLLPLYCKVQNSNKDEIEELYAFNKCSHLIHDKCFEDYYNSFYFKDECPLCKT